MLTDKKVTIPGGSFTSTTGNPMLACSIGANTGHLYVLERSMFFIDKPAINIPYDHIEVVEFLRHSQITSNRNFDMDVRLKVKACVCAWGAKSQTRLRDWVVRVCGCAERQVSASGRPPEAERDLLAHCS